MVPTQEIHSSMLHRLGTCPSEPFLEFGIALEAAGQPCGHDFSSPYPGCDSPAVFVAAAWRLGILRPQALMIGRLLVFLTSTGNGQGKCRKLGLRLR